MTRLVLTPSSTGRGALLGRRYLWNALPFVSSTSSPTSTIRTTGSSKYNPSIVADIYHQKQSHVRNSASFAGKASSLVSTTIESLGYLPCSPTAETNRYFTTLWPDNMDLDGYYHIEASNAIDDKDEDGSPTVVYATKLTVTGPDVDGILASMTVALAMRGCSLVSLHAAKSEDTGFRSQTPRVAYDAEEEQEKSGSSDKSKGPIYEENTIKDVFYVVDRLTGQPFLDEELYDLAESLLESLRTPMAIMGGSAIGSGSIETSNRNDGSEQIVSKIPPPPYATREEQITTIPSTGKVDS